MKTTILGLLCAAASAIQLILQAGADIMDWKTWILPAGLAALGYLAKDADAADIAKRLPAVLLPIVLCGMLPSCGFSLNAAGKPTFALDPVALAQLIQDWQETNDAKDAKVIVVPSPGGQTIVATMPDGKVMTEIINPSGVIVPQP